MQNGPIPVKIAATWLGLMEELYDNAWDASIHRFRSPFVFRGSPDADTDLSSSLLRIASSHEDLASLERHILRNFRKYAHSDSLFGNSLWNWLALAQHHGLQTRLLDWTYSPLIAAHFVTADLAQYASDGAIWCVNHREITTLLPPILREQGESAGSNVFTAEMLDVVAPDLEVFDSLAGDPFVVFLEPPSIDPRIASQFALFSVMSSPEISLDEWLAGRPQLAKKIVIPAAMKWEVRDKLDQAGITERMLYPGLDGLAKWLSRYYTPASARECE